MSSRAPRPEPAQLQALKARGYTLGHYRTSSAGTVWRIKRVSDGKRLPGNFETQGAAYAHAVTLP